MDGYWRTISYDGYPPPHQRYVIRRAEVIYTATPCYGVHDPWWVVKTLTGEAEPVVMLPDDEWQPVTR